jgi:hypothetical protein
VSYGHKTIDRTSEQTTNQRLLDLMAEEIYQHTELDPTLARRAATKILEKAAEHDLLDSDRAREDRDRFVALLEDVDLTQLDRTLHRAQRHQVQETRS